MARYGLAVVVAASLAVAGCVPPASPVGARLSAPLPTPKPFVPPGRPSAAVVPLVAPLTPPGGRAPQFVVVSFDGAGGAPMWKHWREVATRNHAHFTFFLSGVYLLGQGNRSIYRPPHRMPGASDIGMSPTAYGNTDAEEIRALLGNLAGAWSEGDEIGTHFNGHFCGPWGVGGWSSADWTSEVDQFRSLLDQANANNGLQPGVRLPFTSRDIVGERTPCLDGSPETFLPVLAARHFRYDASENGPEGQWPYRDHRLWEMPLAGVPYAGVGSRLLATDYNLYFHDSGGVPGPTARYHTWGTRALGTLTSYFEASYAGNRAPVFLGNHFENWNGSIYTKALTDFVDLECLRPKVRCASYRELADWLDAESLRYPTAFRALTAG